MELIIALLALLAWPWLQPHLCKGWLVFCDKD